jgi:hypothetical protein
MILFSLILTALLVLFWAMIGGVLFFSGIVGGLVAYQPLPLITIDGVDYNAISLCIFQNQIPVFGGQIDYVIATLRALPILSLMLSVVAFLIVGNMARLLPSRSDRRDTIQTITALHLLVAIFFILAIIAVRQYIYDPDVQLLALLRTASERPAACAPYPTPAVVADAIANGLFIAQSVLLVMALALLMVVVFLWQYRPGINQLQAFYPPVTTHCAYCNLNPRNADGTLGCTLCHVDISIAGTDGADDHQVRFVIQHRGGLAIEAPQVRIRSERDAPIESLTRLSNNQGWVRQTDADESVWVSEEDIVHETVTITYGQRARPGQVRVSIRPANSQFWSQWHVVRE